MNNGRPELWTEHECQRLDRLVAAVADHFIDAANGDAQVARKMISEKRHTDKTLPRLLEDCMICRMVQVASTNYRRDREGSGQ